MTSNVFHFNLGFPIVLLLLIMGLMYFTIRKLNVKIHSWIIIAHILFTSVGIFLVMFPNLFTQSLFEVNKIMEMGVFITVFIQLLFIINFFKAYKKLKT